jgi:hypothetical protein
VIPNDALINFLRTELDFHFKRQSDRVMLYKKRGSTQRVEIRGVSAHDETVVRSLLKRAGASQDAIERFISQYKKTN